MKLLKSLLTLAAVAIIGHSAQAVPIITATVGGVTTTVTSSNGTIGGFTFQNLLPSTLSPFVLDLQGLVVTTTTGGTIQFCVMDTVTSPTGFLNAGVSITANGTGSVFQTILVNGVLPGTSTNTLSFTNASSLAMASNTISVAVPLTPYTLANCVSITLSPNGGVSFDAGTSNRVPDSGLTVALLGLGLVALGGFAKFRGIKASA